MARKYAKVIVDNRASQVDKPFTYIIDDSFCDILKIGMRVVVPFGKGNKLIKGLVIGIEDYFNEDYELKSIVDILDDKPLVNPSLISLSLWMRDEYLTNHLDALQPILPPGDFKEINTFVEILNKEDVVNRCEEEKKIISYLVHNGQVLLEDLKKDMRISNINKYLNNLENDSIIQTTIDIKTTFSKKKEKWTKLVSTDKNIDEIVHDIGKRATKQIEIAKYLHEVGESSVTQIVEALNTSLSTVRSLEDKGIVTIFDKEVHRNPIKKVIPYYKSHDLNFEQKLIFDRIMKSIDREDDNNRFLIHGITGSGKTEIYLQLVGEMLSRGKDSIVLVPEISLTPQTIDRFVGRFGHKVAVLHSKLSYGERFDQWRMIKEGKVNIVVGARSAIFAPFQNLGLIVIDEEHESTYKSSQNPKYNTIEVAEMRAKLENALLVMGTATPSIETYYRAKRGEIVLLNLLERANEKELPQISLVDMRDELKKGNKSIFSEDLYDAIKSNLSEHKQTILFLNRRGFSTFVSCRSCGYVAKCNNCDISLTYHRNIDKLRCHYCGITVEPPKICPVCKSKYIKYFGIGTEKVEQLTRELFPDANIVRMDGDTTTAKGSYENILDDMKNHKIDILIGTQMISKGLDFSDVTLVGIIAADTTLNLPDYRSPEKAFQLITQVAGRAGRGDYKGRVILQTYNPEHYSIEFSKNQDYISFYNMELPLRREFLYPPFISLINILIYGENNNKVGYITKEVYNIINRYMSTVYPNESSKYIIGPYPAPLERIKNNYRWQILIKAEDDRIKSLKSLVKRVCIDNEYKLDLSDIKFSIDINPNSTL